MGNPTTKIVCIIPTFNRKNYLKSLLNDIQNQNITTDIMVQVMVVVDGSTDGTIEMLDQQFPLVKYIITSNLWFTKSINEGFGHAYKLNPDYLLTLNDDIRLSKNYINNIYQTIISLNSMCIVGSLSVSHDNAKKITSPGVYRIHPISMKCHAYSNNFTNTKGNSLETIKPSKVLPGRGMLIPTQVAKMLNGFDNRFAQYHSDFDFCLRAAKIGIESYISYNARLFTYEQETSASTSFKNKSLKVFCKQLFDRHSRIHLLSNARYIFRHGIKVLWPVSFGIFLLATINAQLIRPNKT